MNYIKVEAKEFLSFINEVTNALEYQERLISDLVDEVAQAKFPVEQPKPTAPAFPHDFYEYGTGDFAYILSDAEINTELALVIADKDLDVSEEDDVTFTRVGNVLIIRTIEDGLAKTIVAKDYHEHIDSIKIGMLY